MDGSTSDRSAVPLFFRIRDESSSSVAIVRKRIRKRGNGEAASASRSQNANFPLEREFTNSPRRIVHQRS